MILDSDWSEFLELLQEHSCNSQVYITLLTLTRFYGYHSNNLLKELYVRRGSKTD